MEKEKYEAPRMEVVNMQDDVVIACTTAACGGDCSADCGTDCGVDSLLD